MISPAVRVPNSTDRSISSAVSASRVPTDADREMSETSSIELRADRSSSCGSSPRRRTTALAEPLSTRIGSRVAAVNARMTRWVARAVCIGLAMARFFGTSSPKIIVRKVPMSEPDAGRHRADRSRGEPGRLERSSDQVRDGRLGDEADGQIGDRDAHLGPGQLGRQRPQGVLDALRRVVAGVGGPVDLGAVDGDERELGRDEDPTGRDQQQREGQ